MKRGPIRRTLAFQLLELTVRRRKVVCQLNLGGRSHIDSGKQVRVLLECVSCRSYPVDEQDISKRGGTHGRRRNGLEIG